MDRCLSTGQWYVPARVYSIVNCALCIVYQIVFFNIFLLSELFQKEKRTDVGTVLNQVQKSLKSNPSLRPKMKR